MPRAKTTEAEVTEQQFDARLAHIEEQHAARREGADAWRDQELARLFVACGWTQERIAGHLKKGQQWVSRRLIFGRFLDYAHGRNEQTAAETLTERRFRASWALSRGRDEDRRFAQVVTMLGEAAPPGHRNLVRKPGLREAIIDLCGDGVKRTVKEIAALVDGRIPGIDAKQVAAALRGLQKKPPRGQAVEAHHLGRCHRYRLVPRAVADAPPVDPAEAGAAVAQVIPMLAEVRAELKKSMVTMSRSFVFERLAMIERALLRLTAAPVSSS